METLKVACPLCGSIDAFARLKAKLSFASLLGEACISCRHEVSFADVNNMRSRLAKAIGFDHSFAVSTYPVRSFTANTAGRSRGRLLSGA